MNNSTVNLPMINGRPVTDSSYTEDITQRATQVQRDVDAGVPMADAMYAAQLVFAPTTDSVQ